MWVKQLRYFYLKRALGGHANDGDEFRAAFAFTDRQDLLHKIGLLGLRLNVMPNGSPQPVPGRPYPASEYSEFKSVIKQFPDLQQPGHSLIFGNKAFVWVYDNSIQISISGTRDGNAYEVTEDDLLVCIELEKQFDQFAWQKITDPSSAESV